MAEKVISVQDNEQFQTICGSFDENLKLLEQRYHVSIVCRGEGIRIQGASSEVDLAAGVLEHCCGLRQPDRRSAGSPFTTLQKWWRPAHQNSSPP